MAVTPPRCSSVILKSLHAASDEHPAVREQGRGVADPADAEVAGRAECSRRGIEQLRRGERRGTRRRSGRVRWYPPRPPVTSTRPSASLVDVCIIRTAASDPVALNVPAVGS